jgi:hypothetical protein
MGLTSCRRITITSTLAQRRSDCAIDITPTALLLSNAPSRPMYPQISPVSARWRGTPIRRPIVIWAQRTERIACDGWPRQAPSVTSAACGRACAGQPPLYEAEKAAAASSTISRTETRLG